MLFPTLDFGLFFLLVFPAAWLLVEHNDLRKLFLVGASYVFYGWWDWRFCFLLAASSLANWLFGHAIWRQRGNPAADRWLALAVVANLATLGFFKYCNFFIDSLNAVVAALGLGRDLPLLAVVLPVGISFFTFHGISYVVDIHRAKLTRPASLLDLLFYIAFFPQLVAGPIVRAAHFLPQLLRSPDPAAIATLRAFMLIGGGLFKKVIVASYLATNLVDPVFQDPARYGGGDILLAIYGYAIQIFCDFSAYTDIAIGVAALFGYRFPPNFDQPYRAVGFRDFWRRWHISLSSWLRDYLYIPLGGNHGGWKHYRNLLTTMVLGGLWHGAAWTFVIWGGLHGLFLTVEHALSTAWGKRPALTGIARLAAIVLTFHGVCLGWVFFRATNFEQAIAMLNGLTRVTLPLAAAQPTAILLIALGIALQFAPADRLGRWEDALRRIPWPVRAAALGALIVAIDALGPVGVAPFIYFRF